MGGELSSPNPSNPGRTLDVSAGQDETLHYDIVAAPCGKYRGRFSVATVQRSPYHHGAAFDIIRARCVGDDAGGK